MTLAGRDGGWANLYRWLAIFSVILVLSSTDLILGAVWGAKIAKISPRINQQMPSSSYDYSDAFEDPLLISTSELVFYAGTLPFLTIIWTAVSLGLKLATVFAPIAALISSAILFCGWVSQIGVWLYCEVGAPNVNENVPGWCPTSSINKNQSSYSVPYNLGLGKDFLGVVIALTFVMFMVMTAVARSKQRRGGTEDHLLKPNSVEGYVSVD